MSMSDEYVSKVAISKAITAEALAQNLDSLYDNEASRYQRAAERIVAGMPAADVAPVVRGKNIATDYADCDQFVCSECGIELQNWVRVERDEDDGEETCHEYVLRYCPNCGAKMEVHNG